LADDAFHNARVLLVANPISGRGRVARWLPSVADALQACAGGVSVVETRGPGDAERAARAFTEGLILVLGGDGTFSAATAPSTKSSTARTCVAVPSASCRPERETC